MGTDLRRPIGAQAALPLPVGRRDLNRLPLHERGVFALVNARDICARDDALVRVFLRKNKGNGEGKGILVSDYLRHLQADCVLSIYHDAASGHASAPIYHAAFNFQLMQL